MRSKQGATDRFAALSDLSHRVADGMVADDIAASGEARAVAALRRSSARPFRLVTLAAAAALLALGVAFVARGTSRPSLAWTVEGATNDRGYTSAPASSEALIRFSNGTVVTLAPSSRARVGPVTDETVRVVLEDGEARVHDAPRPLRLAFIFDAGPFSVEPGQGAKIAVSWSPTEKRVRVSVVEGTAVLRGGVVRDALRLAGGQQALADLSTASVAVSPLAEQPAPIAPAVVDEPPSGAGGADSKRTPVSPRWSWNEMVSHGDFAGVVADAERRGLDDVLSQRPLPDLVALADAARYAGRRDVARRALFTQRSRFPRSAAASNAAFHLGRLAEDEGRTTEAIAWYDRYLAEADAGPLAAEALGRSMVATSRVSGPNAARPLAERYLARFPQGPHASVAREIARP